MEFILPQKIEDFASANSSPEPEMLRELHRETFLKVLHPRMLSGHLQGRFLSLISQMLRPRTILEIGTYTGYSALCLAEGLAPDGKIITIDCNDELRPIHQKYFRKAGLEGRIEAQYGDALDVIPGLNENWDLVFIDADKCNYPKYFELVRNHIRPGGILLADNVLWTGKVTEPLDPRDTDTAALLAFSASLAADPDFDTALLTIRDGLTMARKKNA